MLLQLDTIDRWSKSLFEALWAIIVQLLAQVQVSLFVIISRTNGNDHIHNLWSLYILCHLIDSCIWINVYRMKDCDVIEIRNEKGYFLAILWRCLGMEPGGLPMGSSSVGLWSLIWRTGLRINGDICELEKMEFVLLFWTAAVSTIWTYQNYVVKQILMKFLLDLSLLT